MWVLETVSERPAWQQAPLFTVLISPTLLLPKPHVFHSRADTMPQTCATPLWMGTAALSHTALTGSFTVKANDYIFAEVFPVSPWDWEIEDAGAGHPGVNQDSLEGCEL